MKRGDLSMGVIIGAAIALLILVLLSVLVLRSGSTVIEGTGCTAIEDAICIPDSDRCGDYNGGGINYISGTRACPSSDDKCCVPFGSS